MQVFRDEHGSEVSKAYERGTQISKIWSNGCVVQKSGIEVVGDLAAFVGRQSGDVTCSSRSRPGSRQCVCIDTLIDK